MGAILVVTLAAPSARADIPAGYKGTPFMGTPWPIPGRIDFENFDLGGMGVGWRVDDHTGNFGVGSCPGNNYRADLPHPQLCETNTNPGEIDLYTAGPLKGTHYPSDAMPQSIYIGYAHGADWVKITVNVATAGMYKLSSVWGSDPGGATGIRFQILFNDVLKADVTLPGTGGYHNWVPAPDFATVQLDAGVQVFEFAPKTNHVNYDYLQFSLVTADGGVDPGSTGAPGGGADASAGTAGATGAADAGAGGAVGAAGSTGTAGAAGAAGATGAAGDTGTAGATGAAGDSGAPGGGGDTGTAGAPGAAGDTGAPGGGTAGSATTGGAGGGSGVTSRASSGGCACTVGASGAETGGLGGATLLLAGVVALARRGRRRDAPSVTRGPRII